MLHIEHIQTNLSFWINCVDIAHQFFRTSISPDSIWYIRPAVKSLDNVKGNSNATAVDSAVDGDLSFMDTSNSPKPLYCCHGPEDGTMIACDNSDFPIECMVPY